MQLVSRRVIWVFVSDSCHFFHMPNWVPWVSVWDVSNVVYFETASPFVRAWPIWSDAYVAIAAVVIVSPLRASVFVGLVA
jgi:hypothetical protein